mmetsp:Transcript_5098/g.11103  ORF Transcript_5098/g.11103 Transcript_5098/m.11103 type:complete len:83 (+) Transcript_5098:1053-1301(+)
MKDDEIKRLREVIETMQDEIKRVRDKLQCSKEKCMQLQRECSDASVELCAVAAEKEAFMICEEREECKWRTAVEQLDGSACA